MASSKKVDKALNTADAEVKAPVPVEEKPAPTKKKAPKEKANKEKVVKTTSKVNFRQDPNLRASVIYILDVGTELTVLGTVGTGKWIRVRHGNKEGYVMAEFTKAE